MWFVVEKKRSITKTREKGGGRAGGEKSVGPRGVWAEPSVPADRLAGGEICHFIVLVSTDTIWRGLYCLKLWVNDIWGAGVRRNSRVPPPDPKSSCERAPHNFSAFSNSSSLPLPPLFTAPLSLLPPSLCVALSLSLFFSLFLRHSLVTAWSSNRTTLFLTRTGSPEISCGAPWVPTPKMKKKK